MSGILKKTKIEDGNELLVGVEHCPAEEIIDETQGKVIPLKEFIEGIKLFKYFDVLGYGFLIIDDISYDSESWLFCNMFKIGDDVLVNLDSLYELFGDRAKVYWIKK